MEFHRGMKTFVMVAEELLKDVLIAGTLRVHESIRVGSPLTAAPGQPVDTSNLLRSWQYEFDDDTNPTKARVVTPVEYAEPVEEGVGPNGPRVYGAKNGIGGSHSVKLTAAAWPKIVDHEVRRLGGGR